MKIALDYGGTYTEDPEFWNGVCLSAAERGHGIMIVTSRPHKEIPEIGVDIPVFCTDGEAKKKYMRYREGISINVWIDNEPQYIEEDKF